MQQKLQSCDLHERIDLNVTNILISSIDGIKTSLKLLRLLILSLENVISLIYDINNHRIIFSP